MKQIEEILAKAKAEMLGHPRHELILKNRTHIYNALGRHAMLLDKDGRFDGAEKTIGLRRRYALGTACVRKVLPIWSQAWPEDARPQKILEMGSDYLTGRTTYRELADTQNDFCGLLENSNSSTISEDKYCSIYVGYAAAWTVGVAISDEKMKPVAECDEELEIYDLDIAFLCSSAYAEGFPFRSTAEKYNPLKAQEFWLWYLDEAQRVYERIVE
jgi:Immunity protein Imm5